MKEVQQHKTEEVQIVKQADQHHKKLALVHRMRPQKGQKLYEYSIVENTVKLAEYQDSGIIDFAEAVKGLLSVKRKVVTKENHFYVIAINFKNAIKQLRKFDPAVNPTIVK